eukprot:scaffold1007_cov324-Pavlova_lutheri.AAC.1
MVQGRAKPPHRSNKGKRIHRRLMEKETLQCFGFVWRTRAWFQQMGMDSWNTNRMDRVEVRRPGDATVSREETPTMGKAVDQMEGTSQGEMRAKNGCHSKQMHLIYAVSGSLPSLKCTPCRGGYNKRQDAIFGHGRSKGSSVPVVHPRSWSKRLIDNGMFVAFSNQHARFFDTVQASPNAIASNLVKLHATRIAFGVREFTDRSLHPLRCMCLHWNGPIALLHAWAKRTSQPMHTLCS